MGTTTEKQKTKKPSKYHGIIKADLIRTTLIKGEFTVIVFGWSAGESIRGPVAKEYKGRETRSINLVGNILVSNTPSFQDFWLPAENGSSLPLEPLYIFQWHDSKKPFEDGLYISNSKKALKKIIDDNGWV